MSIRGGRKERGGVLKLILCIVCSSFDAVRNGLESLPRLPLAKPVQRISQLRVEAASCPRLGIVPLAAGVFYTPEDQVFVQPGLDLSLPSDTLTVPPQP